MPPTVSVDEKQRELAELESKLSQRKQDLASVEAELSQRRQEQEQSSSSSTSSASSPSPPPPPAAAETPIFVHPCLAAPACLVRVLGYLRVREVAALCFVACPVRERADSHARVWQAMCEGAAREHAFLPRAPTGFAGQWRELYHEQVHEHCAAFKALRAGDLARSSPEHARPLAPLRSGAGGGQGVAGVWAAGGGGGGGNGNGSNGSGSAVLTTALGAWGGGAMTTPSTSGAAGGGAGDGGGSGGGDGGGSLFGLRAGSAPLVPPLAPAAATAMASAAAAVADSHEPSPGFAPAPPAAPSPPPPSLPALPHKLFLGGLTWNTTEVMLLSHFAQFGPVESAIVQIGRDNKPRGFGFVTFTEASAAAAALLVPNEIDGRVIEVKRAVPPGARGTASSYSQPGGGQCKLFLGGLAWETTEDTIVSHFGQWGAVESAIVQRDREGKSRGFGFVTFSSAAVVPAVLQAAHTLDGRGLDVKHATAPSNNGGRGGGNGGSGNGASGDGGGGGGVGHSYLPGQHWPPPPLVPPHGGFGLGAPWGGGGGHAPPSGGFGVGWGSGAGHGSGAWGPGASPPPRPPPHRGQAGKLFLGGLAWDTSEDAIVTHFSQFGAVQSAVVQRDRATGKSRGFGFVTFAEDFVVPTVLQATHTLDGRILDVKRATPGPNAPPAQQPCHPYGQQQQHHHHHHQQQQQQAPYHQIPYWQQQQQQQQQQLPAAYHGVQMQEFVPPQQFARPPADQQQPPPLPPPPPQQHQHQHQLPAFTQPCLSPQEPASPQSPLTPLQQLHSEMPTPPLATTTRDVAIPSLAAIGQGGMWAPGPIGPPSRAR
jgi:RNA-binding protein Musashi